MKETYLHYLWRQKRLPFHLLRLKDGRSFKIHSPGFYNAHNAGPDFSESRIEIDGIVWVGPVEIHVRASDWLRHNHHNDRAYDNVILHVVLEDDKPVLQEGVLIPVLELYSVIDMEHYRQFLRFLDKMDRQIPCETLLPAIESLFIREMIDRCSVERMERKYNELVQYADPLDPAETFYRLLARSFGTKHNAAPFEELAMRIPLKSVKHLRRTQKRKHYLETSGLSNREIVQASWKSSDMNDAILKNTVNQMNPSSWNYGGIRPSSHPHLRIEQFVSIIDALDLNLFFVNIPVEAILHYFDELVRSVNSKEKQKQLKISQGLKNQLLINAVSPFLFWWGKVNSNENLQSSALELLDFIPVEDNRLVRDWRKRGIIMETARDSQALIELLNFYCLRKKCLSCSVGNKVLNR